jgi:hypothetical protein
VERRRVALRALLAGGEASSSATPAADEAVRSPAKGLLRGLRCTSAAAAQAFEPEAAAHALRLSTDWRGLGCTSSSAAAQVHAPASADRRGRRRRRGGREGRKARGGASGAGVGGDVWCTPGAPFAAEVSSVDCVVAPHPHQTTAGARSRRAQGERSHREVRQEKKSYFCRNFSSCFVCWSCLSPYCHAVLYRRKPAAIAAVSFITILLLN